MNMKNLVVVLCLLLSCSINAQTNTQTTTVTNPSISDDGYTNVPLQFNFPYYGQNFNNSWMFSNGIISFQDPMKSGLAWSNLSVQPFSSTMGSQFDYSIYALWTDLINIRGTFRTEGNNTFQRYSWMGISPYYDSNRLNTFSVEIRPDGKILTNYTGINVNYAGVGTTGSTSKGEYEQINYFGSTVTTGMVQNWERTTSVVDPCLQNKLSSPSCPGYFEELSKMTTTTSLTQTTEIVQPTTNISSGVTTTSFSEPTNTTTTVSGSISPDRPPTTSGSSSASSSTSTIANFTTATTTSSSTTSSSGVSIGLSVVARNREKEQAIVSQTLQMAVNIASAAASDSQKEALSVVNQSIQTSTNQSGQQNKQIENSTVQSSQLSSSTHQKANEVRDIRSNESSLSNIFSLFNNTNNSTNLFLVPQTQTNTNTTTQQNQLNTNNQTTSKSTQTFQLQEINNQNATLNINILPDNKTTSVTTQQLQNVEEIKTNYSLYRPNFTNAINEMQTFSSQNFLTDRTNPLNQTLENRIVLPESNIARAGPVVNRNVSNNELATGVDINRMALAPAGYDSYLNLTMRDVVFYEPKEIYKNQRNVDNVRALRQLSSDRLHQEMIEQQYKKGN